MKKSLVFILFIFSIDQVFSQQLVQTIRGTIVDKQSQAPLPFVNIIIENSNPIKGTTSDEKGKFKIENVETGRINVAVTSVGYAPLRMTNILLTSTKELILNIEMEENSIKMSEVNITGETNKESQNKMALISAKTFAIEESKRYAGTNNDVSRMAMNFAGVKAGNDAVNEIVIRGNSPNGLLWRLEDIEIPNPNHFGDDGATGGPISMLNNNVLSNSDFLTGAFPAEYGNALSGVFDLKMRNGNDEKREFLSQMGFNGFEFGAEGPILKKTGSSFLINYRYSTLGVLKALGANFGTGTAVPQYQDISFKLHFPTQSFGTFNAFGVGGKNYIALKDSDRDTSELKKDDLYGADYDQDVISSNYTGVFGINHTYLIGNSAFSRLTIAISNINNSATVDSISTTTRANIPYYVKNFDRKTASLVWFINKKINARNNVRIGIRSDKKIFSLIDSTYQNSNNKFVTLRDFDGQTVITQPYAQWQHNLNDKLTFNAGLHYQYQNINSNQIFEPRASLKWNINSTLSFNAGYGLHSQAPPIKYQKMVLPDGNGGYYEPNKNLEFTKSHHYIVGVSKYVTENIKIKLECYYQYIFNAIVEKNTSSYSLLNQGSFSIYEPDALINAGKGKNKGIELSIERYLNKGFYFLSTTSIFDSKYTGSDGIERNTVFNSKYVFNLLVGKEFNLSKNGNSKKYLTVDGKFNWAGGQRYTPLDITKSQLYNSTILDNSQAFSLQLQDYVRLDIRVGYKLIKAKTTHEWAIDGLNVTNHKNPLFIKYVPKTGETKSINQMGFFPMLLYRITF